MRPSEFAILIAFWFLPPCLIAFWLQRRFYARRPGTGRWLRIAAIVGTPIAGVALGLAGLVAPLGYFRFLGVYDVHLMGKTFPLLPLSYVSVALVGAIATWLSNMERLRK